LVPPNDRLRRGSPHPPRAARRQSDRANCQTTQLLGFGTFADNSKTFLTLGKKEILEAADRICHSTQGDRSPSREI
jgi:hypothetical protein